MKELQDTDSEGAQSQEWRQKQEHNNKVKLLAPRATSNIKHSTTPSKVKINTYINGLFTSVPITQYTSLFQ